ncbi:MAG: hypothetical protein KME42_09505 [Tildeniella nuda ZEHNDER 1965/U140]|nr:hypothetical protein [Tildeniella nuda ZEHNDER 1965/U140]
MKETLEASIYMFYLNSQALAFVLDHSVALRELAQIDFGEHNGECSWDG